MPFAFPEYHAPDFNSEKFISAPGVKTASVAKDGVAPENFHSTSIYPEYFKIGGKWKLAEDSRMDCSVVIRPDGSLEVLEYRKLRTGDTVILGRSENCEDGIYMQWMERKWT